MFYAIFAKNLVVWVYPLSLGVFCPLGYRCLNKKYWTIKGLSPAFGGIYTPAQILI
ncbi:hypothetical protein O59_000298 [Cellvibrio sp. BR]|nr:hypothetical protein O59_000298 [Cellvibrio sp. BR]